MCNVCTVSTTILILCIVLISIIWDCGGWLNSWSCDTGTGGLGSNPVHAWIFFQVVIGVEFLSDM